MTEQEITRLCEEAFPNLVERVYVQDPRRNRLRVDLVDGSFIDIHQNPGGRYSVHWQQHGKTYRFNNAPHWDEVETAPHHFHDADHSVHPSPITGITAQDVTTVLQFVSQQIFNE